jgi:hypothetical protein
MYECIICGAAKPLNEMEDNARLAGDHIALASCKACEYEMERSGTLPSRRVERGNKMTGYTKEQISDMLEKITPGEWHVLPYASDYGYDIKTTEHGADIRGDRGMMFQREPDAAFIAAAPDIVRQQSARIAELEAALRFYADPDTHPDLDDYGRYDVGEICLYTPIIDDAGEVARKALGD